MDEAFVNYFSYNDHFAQSHRYIKMDRLCMVQSKLPTYIRVGTSRLCKPTKESALITCMSTFCSKLYTVVPYICDKIIHIWHMKVLKTFTLNFAFCDIISKETQRAQST